MKAMLEPRIVAASIHGPEAFGHGAPGAFDFMTPSSHGWLMTLLIMIQAVSKRQATPETLNHPSPKEKARQGRA
jgi:hypothetical protein